MKAPARTYDTACYSCHELRDTIRRLEGELAQRKDDVQQLRHELQTKTSLLDTFIEEEENQISLADTTTYRDCSVNTDLNVKKPNSPPRNPDSNQEDNLNAPRECKDIAHDDRSNDDQEKLVHTVTYQLVECNKRLCELQDELLYKGEQSCKLQGKICQLQERLRETERQQADLECDNELLKKTCQESSMIQKELEEELKACRNNFSELLQVFLELQKEVRYLRCRDMELTSTSSDRLAKTDHKFDHCDSQFDSLVHNDSSDFHIRSDRLNIELESQYVPNLSTSNPVPAPLSLMDELLEYMQQVGEQQHDDSEKTPTHCNTMSIKRPSDRLAHRKTKNSSESDASEYDSGLHSFNNNVANFADHPSPSSATPIIDDDAKNKNLIDYAAIESFAPSSFQLVETRSHRCLTNLSPDADDQETDDKDEDARDGLSAEGRSIWLGLSSYMFTTIFLLCLSVTFGSSPGNLNSAVPRLELRLIRFD